jgi:pheromone shutdown protein TraB
LQELSAAAVEELKSDDTISLMFNALGEQFPELLSPLIHERDLYLAWSLKRSKAVNGCKQVVGVVGKGHLPGVMYALSHDQGTLRFSDLVGGKNTRKSKEEAAAAAGRRLLFELLLGVGLYAVWQYMSSMPQPGGF